jgi:small subunit ribosomal protein S17
MADETPEHPEKLTDEVENAPAHEDTPVPDDAPAVEAPESIADEVENAQAQDGTPVPAGGEARLPAPERRAARQAARDQAAGAGGGGAAGPKSIEDREAARLERRRANAVNRRNYRARLKAKRAERRAAQPPAEEAHAPEHGPGRPKTRQGVVVSDKADKTVVVRIDVAKRHRRYGKIMRTSSKLHVHDERNDAGLGDTVRVIESRPLSATKRWRLVEVVERAR